MEYLVSAEEMRRADHCVIEEYGVPSLVLMERAALASVELMEREGFDLSRVLVVSGSGNNGGDGFAMARILYLKGIEAELWFVGNPGPPLKGGGPPEENLRKLWHEICAESSRR